MQSKAYWKQPDMYTVRNSKVFRKDTHKTRKCERILEVWEQHIQQTKPNWAWKKHAKYYGRWDEAKA